MPYNAAKAITFLKSKSGRYDDGECWTLAEHAVTGAGGTSSKTLTPNFSPAASFVWGTVVAASQLKPGDVLQFSGYDWTREIVTEVKYPPYHPNGDTTDSKIEGGKRGSPQHTAIVVNVIAPGVVDVIEQNIPPTTGPVQTAQLVLTARPKSVTTTRVTVTYEEGAVDATGKKVAGATKTGDIVTTVTITETVANPPRCYRPK
jgi:hypothetical protein